jgi:hypothetical protein
MTQLLVPGVCSRCARIFAVLQSCLSALHVSFVSCNIKCIQYISHCKYANRQVKSIDCFGSCEDGFMVCSMSPGSRAALVAPDDTEQLS